MSVAATRRIQALHRRKTREAEGQFLAEGVRVVEDLLDSSLSIESAVVASSLGDSPRTAALLRRLQGRTVVTRVSDAELARLAATDTPQGVLAVAGIPRYSLEALEPGAHSVVLVLDAVQDPGNFGTMLRTADALGAAFVAMLPGTVDPWNPKVVRAAAGASFRTPVVATTPGELVPWLRERAFRLLGAAADGRPVGSFELPARAALVLGNEGAGVGGEMRAALDDVVSIPIRGAAESLNVAVAAGILLYVLTRESAS